MQLVSPVERAKWVIVVIAFLDFALGLYDDPQAIISYIPNIFIFVIAYSYQHRMMFDKAQRQARYFHGLTLFGVKLFSIVDERISFDDIDNIQFQTVFNRHKVEIIARYGRSDAKPMSLTIKAKDVSARFEQLRGQFVLLGLNTSGAFNGVTAKTLEQDQSIALDKDSVKFFWRSHSRMFGAPTVINHFPILKWRLRLPKQFNYKVRTPAILGLMFGAVIAATSQMWLGAAVVSAIGIAASLLSYVVIANRHFHIPGQSFYDVEVDEHQLRLPAAFFDNRQSRTLNKNQIKHISVQWNWLYINSGNGTGRSRKEAYIFDITLELDNGERIDIPSGSFDSNRFVQTLHAKGYQVAITLIDKTPMKWRFYLIWPLLIFGFIALAVVLYQHFLI